MHVCKEKRHALIAKGQELVSLNDSLEREIRNIESRPLSGIETSIKNARKLQAKINRLMAEWVHELSNIVCYSPS